jgi:NAD(P)-dependent dehydrogenase (short-subunit alcohol dehydrogenase family)
MPLFSAVLNAPLKTWQGRWVWVLGASIGIGRATASALHRQGARAIVSARQADALEAFVKTHPGFVQMPLTAQNEFKMPALISPDEAAQHMLDGWAHGRFEMNFPRRFTAWMRLLRCLPDAWYFAAVRCATGA